MEYPPGIYIYAFHMPLFFMISGVCFNYSKHTEFLPFLASRLKSLILPAVVFTILDIIISHLVTTSDIQWNTFLWKGFTRAKWFLGVLFAVEILYYCTLKFCHEKKITQLILITLCLLIGICLSKRQIILPYSLSTVFVAIFYYGLGYIFRDKIIGNNNISWEKIGWKVFSFSIFLFLVITSFVGQGLNMSSNTISIIDLFPSLLGIITIISFSKKITDRKNFSVLLWLGRNTLVIMCVHMTFISISSTIIKPYINSYMAYKIIEQFFVWSLSILSVCLVNKYALFLIGKPLKKVPQNNCMVE